MNTPGWFSEFFRSIFAALDSVGYWLLEGIYNVFFTVSSAEIISGDAVSRFYTRIQLILAVFMIFKLSLAVLNIIINPDSYKDKQKGAGSLITRIAVMIVMLTLIVPINIPNAEPNSLNAKINENGILFGFLYQFQDVIIRENIFGKLILGSNIDTVTDESGNFNMNLNNVADIGGMMSLTVAQTFMTPTLVDENADVSNIKDFNEDNVACYNELNNDIHYFERTVSASYLLDNINETCNNGSTGEVFAMQYTVLGGFVFSLVMFIIILGFTVDVAVRAIKLAILRIIAPVPIISYVSPGSEKDGAFGNWVKTLTSTYLDLFIRLAVIYFGAYVINEIALGNLNILQTGTNWVTSSLATVFVIIGILVFMKQAPKFFRDMLGLKGESHLFSGIGAALGGAALIGGISGSVISGARTGYEEGRVNGQGVARSTWRAVRAGFGGFVGGAYAGGKAIMTNDKKIPSSVISSMQRRNAIRAAGSTWAGRLSDSAHGMFLGGSPVDRMDAQVEGYKNVASLAKSIFSQAEADGDWIDPNTMRSVKYLKQRYENLQNTEGISYSDLTRARKEFEDARDNRVMDMMDKFNSGKPLDGNFAPQMARDYENILGTVNKLGLDLANLDNVKAIKAAQHTALHKARNIEQSGKYNSRKKNQQFNKH